jgi:hypothetical protein
MSTVKISELPVIDHYSTNTEATLVVGVDLSTGTTGKSTLTTLGEGLYAYQPLKVGQNQVLFSNTIGQFSGNSNTFLQINNQNFSSLGSSDYVASTSDSDNLTKYIDLGINGSAFSDPVYTAMKPYDGYLYSYGSSALSASGNLVIGTASAYANIVYIVGGTVTANIVARMSKTALEFSSGYALKFGDGTTQTTASNPAAYSTAAYAQANVTIGVDVTQNSRMTIIESTNVSQNVRLDYSNSAITIIQGVDTTQNTAIAATDGKMQSAYNTANSALPNTTGTFAGTLNILNNLTVNGTVVLANTNFVTTEAAFRITGTGSSQTPTQSGTLMQLTSKQNTPARVLIDSIGTSNTSYSIIAGRTARGTVGAPTATQNNDILLRIAGNSYGTTGYAPFGDARIDFIATEDHSDTARGSRIRFWNTPIGTNTVNEIASFNGDSVTFTGTVAPTKGFIHTSLVYPSAQTAITIDFANNSMVRAQTSSGIVVSMSNYTIGKIVELWITNTAGTNQTYTTGVSAINSTLNATTYTIPGTSTVCARYFCVDGTLANTLVSVIHA